jgi:hypothetical protein
MTRLRLTRSEQLFAACHKNVRARSNAVSVIENLVSIGALIGNYKAYSHIPESHKCWCL